jgi:hypothetical protein
LLKFKTIIMNWRVCYHPFFFITVNVNFVVREKKIGVEDTNRPTIHRIQNIVAFFYTHTFERIPPYLYWNQNRDYLIKIRINWTSLSLLWEHLMHYLILKLKSWEEECPLPSFLDILIEHIREYSCSCFLKYFLLRNISK